MKRASQTILAAVLLMSPSAASAQGLTETQARAAIAPWYSLFNVATRGDVKAIHEQVLTADYESCAGYLPGECWGRETSIKVIGDFAKSIPDLTFEIREVFVDGDRVLVNDPDPALRNNRLALLAQLRFLFAGIADLSRLPG